MAARKKRGKRKTKRKAKRTTKRTAKRKVAKRRTKRRVAARAPTPRRKSSKRSRSAKAAHKRRKAAAAAGGGILSYFGRRPAAEEKKLQKKFEAMVRKAGKKMRSPWSSFRPRTQANRIRKPDVAVSRYGKWSRKLAGADWAPPGMERAAPVRVVIADPRFGGHEFSD